MVLFCSFHLHDPKEEKKTEGRGREGRTKKEMEKDTEKKSDWGRGDTQYDHISF